MMKLILQDKKKEVDEYAPGQSTRGFGGVAGMEEGCGDMDEDRCSDKAKSVYKDNYPSAYAGGAIKRCRDGKIWQTEALDDLEEAYTEDGQEACSECLREYIEDHFDTLTEAKYQGREVPLGKPMKGDVKKSKVYVKNPKTGKVIKVNFGDKNMRIKKSNPKRRKSFRARHNCANPGPKTKAKYWSCKAW